jgi:hypothetical protein
MHALCLVEEHLVIFRAAVLGSERMCEEADCSRPAMLNCQRSLCIHPPDMLSGGSACLQSAQVMSKALKEAGYYKKKGVVEKLAGKFVAQICMADSRDVLQARD